MFYQYHSKDCVVLNVSTAVMQSLAAWCADIQYSSTTLSVILLFNNSLTYKYIIYCKLTVNKRYTLQFWLFNDTFIWLQQHKQFQNWTGA